MRFYDFPLFIRYFITSHHSNLPLLRIRKDSTSDIVFPFGFASFYVVTVFDSTLETHPNSQLKCLTERIRFFALTKPSAVRRYSRYVERNEAKSGRKRWCTNWAILTRISISRLGTKNEPLSTPEKSATLSLSQELREVAERCYEWLRYSISKISLKMKT